jgi:Flp pilus assembly protein TadB
MEQNIIKNKRGSASLISGMLVIFLIFILIGFGVYWYYVNYTYERDIGAYFDNAVDCITPECILIQLNDGRQAIVDAGLTEDMYGVFIFKKPDNSMKFQYQHIDAIIERAESVQDWKDKVYANGTQAETMKDVYTEKMDNLRNYIIGEGYRSDWIAKDTWMIKNHLFIYFGWAMILFFIGLIILLTIIAVMLEN